MSDVEAARRQIADVGRRLLADGLVRGTSGNLSVCLREAGRILITPTGVPYDRIGPAEVSAVTLDGHRLEGPAPSSETPMHAALYRRRPDMAAIVHTHSHYATVFSVLRRPIEPVHYLIALAGRRVPVAEYATYGSERLAENAARALGDDRCVLLANHGLVAVGASLEAAYAVALAVEEVAALDYHARLVGTPRRLSESELAEAEEKLARYGRRD